MCIQRVVAKSSIDKHTLNPTLRNILLLELDIVYLWALFLMWKLYVIGNILSFTNVCAKVNPKLFEMVDKGG